jgi:mannose-6-phosphate isomerase-like protein (cupin superfamily)
VFSKSPIDRFLTSAHAPETRYRHMTLATPLTHPHIIPAETHEALGAKIRFLVPSEATNNAWSMCEHTLPPRFAGAAPHLHRRTTEAFHVLEGELTLRIGDETFVAHSGDSVVVTPGTVHAFSNASNAPVRMMEVTTPGGHDAFLRELIALARSGDSWPPSDPAALLALAARHDTFYLHHRD